MGLTILDGDYFHAERRGRVVVVRRSAKGFDTLQEVERVHARLAEAVEALPRSNLGFYLDLRRAPSRNDPGFEEAIAPHRARFLSGWSRAAVVVESAVGGLQIRRHAAEDGTDVHVFDDPDRALAFVRGAGAP